MPGAERRGPGDTALYRGARLPGRLRPPGSVTRNRPHCPDCPELRPSSRQLPGKDPSIHPHIITACRPFATVIFEAGIAVQCLLSRPLAAVTRATPALCEEPKR